MTCFRASRVIFITAFHGTCRRLTPYISLLLYTTSTVSAHCAGRESSIPLKAPLRGWTDRLAESPTTHNPPLQWDPKMGKRFWSKSVKTQTPNLAKVGLTKVVHDRFLDIFSFLLLFYFSLGGFRLVVRPFRSGPMASSWSSRVAGAPL